MINKLMKKMKFPLKDYVIMGIYTIALLLISLLVSVMVTFLVTWFSGTHAWFSSTCAILLTCAFGLFFLHELYELFEEWLYEYKNRRKMR